MRETKDEQDVNTNENARRIMADKKERDSGWLRIIQGFRVAESEFGGEYFA